MKIEIVTSLIRQEAKIFAELRQTKETVLITEHGKPSAYLVDADACEMMQDRMEILEGIARGEGAILDGRVLSHTEAKSRMDEWLD